MLLQSLHHLVLCLDAQNSNALGRQSQLQFNKDRRLVGV